MSLARTLFYLFAAAGWLIAALLGLEVAERGRSLLGEWRYAAYFKEQNAKVYRMVAEEELKSEENQFVLAGAEVASALVSNGDTIQAEAACDENAPDIVAARLAYAERDDEARSVVMTARGELEAVFDGERRLLEMRGDPYFERFVREAEELNGLDGLAPALMESLRQKKSTEAPIPFTLRHLTVEAEVAYQRPMGVIPERFTVSLRERDPIFLPPDPPLGPEFSSEIPNVRYKRNWRPKGQMATYNNYGFRDDDIVMPKPEGLFRIVCIGGSTTEEGNSNDQTYPNIMERKLREQFGTGRLEVINCGVSGIHSYHERRRMEDFLALDPDLIVYYNGINDICHEHFPTIRAMAPEGAQRLLVSKLLTRVFNRRLLPPDEALMDFMWRSTFRNLRAMAMRARECGVDFAVCSFAYPRLERLGFRDRIYLDMNTREVYNGAYINYASLTHLLDLHNVLVRRLCEQEKLFYIPAQEHLDAGSDHFFDTCHITPLGLEYKTNIIGAYVARRIEPRLTPPR
ncbi:MAG: hypothetical protein RLZZ303_1054 [Candidatus Hydrogenedentota bacterium]|jgi:hypothetical protein